MGLSELSSDFDPGPRFEIVRTLGRGGMGVVYAARDRERGRHVALKTLTSSGPESLVRFKNEFRALADIHHENLVSLGELIEASGRLFFTMELVEGVSFVDHVRPAGDRFDERRLRDCLRQLAEGLVALHDAGKIHRDVKPSNVLVSASGRVVVLDFGLVTDASRREHGVLGTPNYMAPEQALGQPVGPAADWYAVGVMLYRALTGALPFDLRGATAAQQKIRRAVIVAPSARSRAVPRDLDDLCVGLLDVDPTLRPTGREVLDLLSDGDEAPRSIPAPASPSCVGRARELAALADAFARAAESGPIVVAIEGDSGLGKSTVLRGFLDRLPAGATTLRGRCYERVEVPFRAVDELMDDLAERIAGAPGSGDPLPPVDLARLGEVFPVLRAGGSTPARRGSAPDDSLSETAVVAKARRAAPAVEPDPIERRARLFAAAREVFARLALGGPLVLALDDVQWADDDGLALLADVLRPPGAPRLLLVLTCRPGANDRLARLGVPVERIALGPMRADDALDLAASMLAASGADPHAAPDLVSESAGHPMLLDALVRHRITLGGAGPVRLADAIRARAAALDPRAQALLEPIVVAGGPVLIDVIEHAAATEGEEATRLFATLRAANLVRLSGSGRGARVEPFHDRVREAVLAALPEAQRQTWHRLLAGALDHTGLGRPDELALAWDRAGAPDRAAPYAERAGDLAAARAAFDQAARHYRAALDQGAWTPDAERRIAIALGDALVNAGRGREAAEAFLRAGRRAPRSESLALLRRAAEAFLRAGYVDEGMAVLREVASAIGIPVPGSAAEAIARTLASRVDLALRGRLLAPRAAPPDEREALRVDLCWSAATGLGVINPLLGVYYQTLGLRLARASGDAFRFGRALALDAAFEASLDARVPDEALGRAEALGRTLGSDLLLAMTASTRGVALFSAGRVREALSHLFRADELLRDRCSGVAWERGSTTSYIVWSLWIGGDFEDLRARLPVALREAEERGDRYLAANLRTSLGNTFWLLFEADPARARREADLAMEAWSRAEGFHVQHLFDAEARLFTDLWVGDAEYARRRLAAVWLAARAAMVFQVTHLRIFFAYLRALATLSCPRLRRLEAHYLVRLLERERGPWAEPFAACARASLLGRTGDRAGALASLDAAVARFDREGLAGYAAAARLRRGQLRGAAGRDEAEGALAWLSSRGIVEPLRAAAMLVPPIT